jgi:hypothetical protein
MTARICGLGLRERAVTGGYPAFAGNRKEARPRNRATAGTHRLLAGSLQTDENSYGRIVFKEARKVDCFQPHEIREDKSVRNVAFSIMLSALALLQIAVVAAELSPSRVEIAAAGKSETDARQVLASTEKDREVSITL